MSSNTKCSNQICIRIEKTHLTLSRYNSTKIVIKKKWQRVRKEKNEKGTGEQNIRGGIGGANSDRNKSVKENLQSNFDLFHPILF